MTTGWPCAGWSFGARRITIDTMHHTGAAPMGGKGGFVLVEYTACIVSAPCTTRGSKHLTGGHAAKGDVPVGTAGHLRSYGMNRAFRELDNLFVLLVLGFHVTTVTTFRALKRAKTRRRVVRPLPVCEAER